jgi:hypothetical protein
LQNKCIAKETELITERLGRGSSVPDPEERPNQSTQIRQLALSYMSKEEQRCQYVHLIINVRMVVCMRQSKIFFCSACLHSLQNNCVYLSINAGNYEGGLVDVCEPVARAFELI